MRSSSLKGQTALLWMLGGFAASIGVSTLVVLAMLTITIYRYM
jgi:hypothetical protein